MQLLKMNEIYDGTSEYKRDIGHFDPEETVAVEIYRGFRLYIPYYRHGEENTIDYTKGFKFYIYSLGKLYTNHILYTYSLGALKAAKEAIDSGYIPERKMQNNAISRPRKLKMQCPNCGHIHKHTE